MPAHLLIASTIFAASLAVGQLLLKFAADDVKDRLSVSIVSAALSPWLVGALTVYGLTTILWLWILSQAPLSKAYPFALLGAALVPLMAFIVLKEQVSPYFGLGMLLVVIGVGIVQLT